MKDNILHALIFIQNWGEKEAVLDILKPNSHVISLYHIMGKYSYLLDTNFDNKVQLEEWINFIKSVKLASGIPAIRSLETQKIIRIYKTKDDFKLDDYQNSMEKYHFFMMIDNPHHDEEIIKFLSEDLIVHSILHIQGNNSFIVEVITKSFDKYKDILRKTEKLQSIQHIETLEVISVNKYRNQLYDDAGNLIYPEKDIRELYTL